MIFQWNFRKFFCFEIYSLCSNRRYEEYTRENWNDTVLHAFLVDKKKKNKNHNGLSPQNRTSDIYLNSHVLLLIVLFFNDLFQMIVRSDWKTIPPEFAKMKWGKYFCIVHYIVRCVVFYIANLYTWPLH